MKEKKSAKKVILAVIICAVAALFVAFGVFWKKSQNMKIIVNGETVSENGLSGAVAAAAAAFDNAKVTITENGSEELTGTFSEMGYTADQEKMKEEAQATIDRAMESFSSKLKAINSGISLTIRPYAALDEGVFASFVKSSSFATPRVSTTDGSIDYDETSKKFLVTEPVKGNEIDDAVLRKAVKAAIDKAVEDGSEEEGVTVAVPEDAYVSEELSAQMSAEELKKEADALNKYAASRINYQFGSETVTLDASTFKDWMSYDRASGTVTLDDEAVRSYVVKMKAKYDTRYKDRGFITSVGLTIAIPASHNEYGYTISQSKEIDQLKADLASGREVTREPVYATKNDYGNPVFYKRNGVDDLNGNYVEVDITRQHIWFYKDGALVVEGDCVTGDISKNRGTITGAFPLAYKESPSVLSSQVNGYEENVNYWMPFYDGQGLHDAPWRSAFGGTIYNGHGSHGCVNLPEDIAAAIYNNITSGTAIILYTES
ncbi:MAG: L,D-transpeptidase family protein [Lachnospiraceae bacterium]|nr:L,D-transpeptidase family protein [Lachnospiraceae bacterium]